MIIGGNRGVLGESSGENQTLRPKPQTVKYVYSLLSGKFWGHFTEPSSDLTEYTVVINQNTSDGSAQMLLGTPYGITRLKKRYLPGLTSFLGSISQHPMYRAHVPFALM